MGIIFLCSLYLVCCGHLLVLTNANSNSTTTSAPLTLSNTLTQRNKPTPLIVHLVNSQQHPSPLTSHHYRQRNGSMYNQQSTNSTVNSTNPAMSCTEGHTYWDQSIGQCTNCSITCPSGGYVSRQCNRTHDLECQCHKGMYMSVADKICKPCTECHHGWGVWRTCRWFRNTVCRKCQPGTFSGASVGTLGCIPCKKCALHQEVVVDCDGNRDTVCVDRVELRANLSSQYHQLRMRSSHHSHRLQLQPIRPNLVSSALQPPLSFSPLYRNSAFEDIPRDDYDDGDEFTNKDRSNGDIVKMKNDPEETSSNWLAITSVVLLVLICVIALCLFVSYCCCWDGRALVANMVADMGVHVQATAIEQKQQLMFHHPACSMAAHRHTTVILPPPQSSTVPQSQQSPSASVMKVNNGQPQTVPPLYYPPIYPSDQEQQHSPSYLVSPPQYVGPSLEWQSTPFVGTSLMSSTAEPNQPPSVMHLFQSAAPQHSHSDRSSLKAHYHHHHHHHHHHNTEVGIGGNAPGSGGVNRNGSNGRQHNRPKYKAYYELLYATPCDEPPVPINVVDPVLAYGVSVCQQPELPTQLPDDLLLILQQKLSNDSISWRMLARELGYSDQKISQFVEEATLSTSTVEDKKQSSSTALKRSVEPSVVTPILLADWTNRLENKTSVTEESKTTAPDVEKLSVAALVKALTRIGRADCARVIQKYGQSQQQQQQQQQHQSSSHSQPQEQQASGQQSSQDITANNSVNDVNASTPSPSTTTSSCGDSTSMSSLSA